MKTHTIGSDSITCNICGRTSHNPNDVKNHYCGHCHLSLEEVEGLIKMVSPNQRTYKGVRASEMSCVFFKEESEEVYQILDPRRSQKVYNHSPDGFEWGYGGSGPSQLALAILLDMEVSEGRAQQIYQQFKADVIAKLPREGWELSHEDINFWLFKAGWNFAKDKMLTQ